ncbi:MAG: T9SS type A sorting domain-containing protein [Bacteroidia bacterium]
MKTKLFFTFLLFSVFANTKAQTWLWAKSANGSANNGGCSVSADAKGNVFATGIFQSPSIIFDTTTLTNIGSANIYIVKYDANGNVLWAKSAGGTSVDRAYSISADVTGNALITGYFSSPTISFGSITLMNSGRGDEDIFIAKYDGNGNVLWAKSAGGTDSDEGYSVSTDSGNNVFITGYFRSPSICFGSDTLINTGREDVFIAKYNSNGNVLWAKSASGSSEDESRSISTDNSGNVFLTGFFYSPTIVFDSTALTNADSLGYNDDVFIAKYDGNGNMLWAKSAGGTRSDEGSSVSVDASGNVFLTGGFASPAITFDLAAPLINTDTAVNTFQIFIVKYDSGGNALWAKSAAGTTFNFGYSVSADVDGSVFITGLFESPTIIFGDDTLTLSPAYHHYFVVKYDSNGNVLCASAITTEVGYTNSISADPFGNAFIEGSFAVSPFIVSSDTLTNVGVENSFIAKFTCEKGTGINELSNKENIFVYPNPTNGIFNFQVSRFENAQMKIYNVYGECIYQHISTSSNSQINLSAEPNGMYFIQAITPKEILTKKIVVNR